jgi:tRNA modification GTPase
MTALSVVDYNSHPTIASIATPPGVGGLSVIRISGPKAHTVGQSISANPKRILKPRYALYTPIISPRGEEIDSGVITYFPSPDSYTGEDVIEVSCHGGNIISRQILDACFALGCEPAGPGEFTKRAFLNGKMDLLQAEAVAALIVANSSISKAANYRILSGRFSTIVNELRSILMDLVITLEAELDFTEDEITPLPTSEKVSLVSNVLSRVDSLLSTYSTGKMLTGGAVVVFVGEPNVGKSSLLNSILSEERTIVSNIPGTTRDAVEVPFLIKGFPVRFVDTAGLRDAADAVEQKGVHFSREYMNKADLLIYVSEAATDAVAPSPPNSDYLPKSSSLPVIHVLNKCDLLTNGRDRVAVDEHLFTSALTGDGITLLLETIHTRLVRSSVISEEIIITSGRHNDALRRVRSSLEITKKELDGGASTDALASDLRIAVSALDELLGVTTADDILDNIFSKFCIGK